VKRIASLCLALAALGVLAGTASAAVLPPGNSAANQYAESLPGAGGNETPSGGSTQPGEGGKSGAQAPSGEGAISPETAAELEKLGPAGKATLDLAAGTAPKPPKGTHSKNSKNHRGDGGAAGAAPAVSGPNGSSGVGEVLGGLSGTSSSGGLGFLQPLLIALALIVAVAYALRRRRGPGELGARGDK
jgi:hypothetical protein